MLNIFKKHHNIVRYSGNMSAGSTCPCGGYCIGFFCDLDEPDPKGNYRLAGTFFEERKSLVRTAFPKKPFQGSPNKIYIIPFSQAWYGRRRGKKLKLISTAYNFYSQPPSYNVIDGHCTLFHTPEEARSFLYWFSVTITDFARNSCSVCNANDCFFFDDFSALPEDITPTPPYCPFPEDRNHFTLRLGGNKYEMHATSIFGHFRSVSGKEFDGRIALNFGVGTSPHGAQFSIRIYDLQTAEDIASFHLVIITEDDPFYFDESSGQYPNFDQLYSPKFGKKLPEKLSNFSTADYPDDPGAQERYEKKLEALRKEESANRSPEGEEDIPFIFFPGSAFLELLEWEDDLLLHNGEEIDPEARYYAPDYFDPVVKYGSEFSISDWATDKINTGCGWNTDFSIDDDLPDEFE